MKKISIFSFLIFSVLNYAQGINFTETSFHEILAQAKKENKLVFLDAYASWCGPCKLMEKNIFSKETVGQFFNANFINAHFDMEKGEGRDIALKYAIRSYPSYLFLNGEGDLVYRGLGYLGEAQFLALAKEANEIGKGDSAKEKFAKGEKDLEFLLSTLKMYINTDADFAKQVSERYFSIRPKKEYSQEEVSMLLYFLKSANDNNYKSFVQDKSFIIKHLSEKTYNEFDKHLKINTLVEKSTNVERKSLDENLFLSEVKKIVNEEEAKNLLKKLKINFYPRIGKYEEFAKVATEYYKDGEGFDEKELGSVAYLFSENIKDMAYLKQALRWAEKIIMKNETAETNYLLAKLYLQTGNKDAAKMYAEQSVNLTKQKGADASIPQKLLSEIK